MAIICKSRWIDAFFAGVAFLPVLIGSPVAAKPLSLDEKIAILVQSYPEMIDRAGDGHVYLKNGGRPVLIDDGRRKSHFDKLETGDIEDSLQQAYPAGPCATIPGVNVDPGRIRSEPLMRALYGNSAKAVRDSLVPVDWFGQTLQVTRLNGVSTALAKVRDDLSADLTLKPYLAPSAGVFNWRKVSGQANLSVHSFGAAIDLNTKFADYWVWAGGRPGKVPEYRNRIPLKIIAIFEKHGFIWGGRWYHYDTMHFEYRPELLTIASREGVSACP